MRKVLLIIIAVILFLAFVSYGRNNPKTIITRLVRKGNVLSGDLRYRIYLLGILPIGEATLGVARVEEHNGQQLYHLTATAKSSRLLSSFLNAEAILDSYIDQVQYCPVLFKQKVAVSGRQDINKEVIYDQKNGIMSIGGVKRQILPGTHDPLSAVFNIGRMNFGEEPEKLEMNINTNQKNYILKGTVTQEMFVIDKKTYKVFMAEAEIKRRDKNPYHKSRISMVMLKEKENIPILIKVFAGEVSITARLIEVK